MAVLHSKQRSLLEKTVIAARAAAARAAEVALRMLAVEQAQAFARLSEEERTLRVRLRAEARRLGDGLERDAEKPFPALVTEVAYAQWHRMLFARFLAENGLLMHPDGVPVTLAECAELAAMEGEPDGWVLAARYAAAMLPGIFRPDDPVMQVRLAAEGRLALERLVNELPAEVFTADDGLGWVYQFWQTRRKKEVNESGAKVSGADIAAVTQLFTEDYMVQFLLQNSLGAWWAARHPDDPTVGEMEYLRRKEDGTPAAGSFPGWPERAAELKILDPCCGSGHFLVAAFELMRRFRMREESLGEAKAGDAVLRDNLFGLELDPRCTQIAAFALALAAWKAGGYRPLPLPNIACSGLPVGDRLHEWTHLADGDPDVEATLRRLFHLFRDAPDLGSLIDPARVAAEDELFAPDWEHVWPLLDRALAKERNSDDPTAAVFGEAARGAARATKLLVGTYHLVATNVPYLACRKHGVVLRRFLMAHHPHGSADLASAFVERCLAFSAKGGTCAVVTPHNWLFLGSYKALRERLLRKATWGIVARLGPGAFETISGEVVKAALLTLTNALPGASHVLMGLDVSCAVVPGEKADALRDSILQAEAQAALLRNPNSVVAFGGAGDSTLLERYATGLAGILSGDSSRFRRYFWEMAALSDEWNYLQSTVEGTQPFAGRESVLLWQQGQGQLRELAVQLRERLHDADRRGNQAWGKQGIAASSIGSLPVTLYTGELFDNNTAVILPRDPAHLPAIWAFCRSPEFNAAVRRVDQALKVTNATLVKVPFDLERWRKVAEEMGPLPEPHSDDPTQWLFHGHPARATEPLQVAVARLLGYRWPQDEGDGLAEGVEGAQVMVGGPGGGSGAVPGGGPGAEPPGYTGPTPLKRAPDGDCRSPIHGGSSGVATGFQPVAWAEDAPPGYTGQTPLKRADEAEDRHRSPIHGGLSCVDTGFQPVARPGAADGSMGAPGYREGDGIVCLPAVAGEAPGAERVRGMLAAAYGAEWTPAVQERLLAAAGFGGKGLEEWLRDGFFARHCQVFHNRPFMWQIWDGRKDGFSALVNYHQLDRAKLQKLIYTYLGAWISAQRDADSRGEAGANARLVAAQELQKKLEAILEGEPPYDIYVRWRPLANQPIGWEPDLNDGVRLNIRPFVTAGVLRSRFSVHWRKDRGLNPDGSERMNDLHFSRAEKEAARRGADGG